VATVYQKVFVKVTAEQTITLPPCVYKKVIIKWGVSLQTK